MVGRIDLDKILMENSNNSRPDSKASLCSKPYSRHMFRPLYRPLIEKTANRQTNVVYDSPRTELRNYAAGISIGGQCVLSPRKPLMMPYSKAKNDTNPAVDLSKFTLIPLQNIS